MQLLCTAKLEERILVRVGVWLCDCARVGCLPVRRAGLHIQGKIVTVFLSICRGTVIAARRASASMWVCGCAGGVGACTDTTDIT